MLLFSCLTLVSCSISSGNTPVPSEVKGEYTIENYGDVGYGVDATTFKWVVGYNKDNETITLYIDLYDLVIVSVNRPWNYEHQFNDFYIKTYKNKSIKNEYLLMKYRDL